MNIDIKLKTYEQLQSEVIALNTNSYLKDLKIDQLQSNWNSLREWLKEFKEYEKSEFQTTAEFYITVEEVLDKMNELEGKDNNE